ncbi:hypothetical protein HPP92_015658 [Vanilla planifolia]|uniref:Uncharacterized protein n=1 Tax=Vanilla planifolia TaxID=51239 RepID=A0A835UW10_VANPL|nr:hypothetical protein HPP92_015658 [Vanilla planifolia]
MVTTDHAMKQKLMATARPTSIESPSTVVEPAPKPINKQQPHLCSVDASYFCAGRKAIAKENPLVIGQGLLWISDPNPKVASSS